MQQIAYLVQLGAVKPICDLLVAKDVKIVRVLLDAINNVLKVRIMCTNDQDMQSLTTGF